MSSAAAYAEWRSALGKSRLWINLALEDLRDRYRRTLFGLMWVVISFVLFVVVKVAIFGQLNKVSTAEFGMFLTIGFGLWNYIRATILEGCAAYIHSRTWIQGTDTPYPVFLLQVVFRNSIVFAMILVVMLITLIWKPTPWTLAMLWAIPGFFAYFITSIWMVALLAPICARFRDIKEMSQTVMRLIFFATPILWVPKPGTMLGTIANMNPATYFLSLIRDPLVYDKVSPESWLVVLGFNVIGIPLAWLVYVRTRPKIIFWI